MSSRHLSRACLWLLLSSLAWPVSSRAQTRSDLERAEASFRAGAAAYAAGDYPAAIQALGAAYTLTPLPAIAFSLAQAERRQYFAAHERAHLERAIELFRSYVKQVESGGRRADALDALSQLEPLFTALFGATLSDTAARDAAEKTRLMITSQAPDARISLDGHPPAPSPLIREVSPGQHQVVVEARGFHRVEREVTALLGELILSEIELPAQPSIVRVSTALDAELFVDGEFRSQGGPRVSLQLPAGTHQLAVAARGRRVVYRTLELARGSTTSLRVELEPTRLRKTARALFVAGGVGFGTAITLSLLTLQAQGQAEDFLARQERGNVSPAMLEHYHDDVASRDHLRIGAAVSLAAATGLFVSGLFLHQLDQPNSREIHRRAHALPEAREPPQQAQLQLSPWLQRAGAGAALQVRY